MSKPKKEKVKKEEKVGRCSCRDGWPEVAIGYRCPICKIMIVSL